MGLFRNRTEKTVTVSKYKMITDEGDGYYAWNGNLYHSDIVRAAIRPKARAIGKTVAKHVRETYQGGKRKIEVNPDAYMRFLLEEPNELMTGQMLQEKLATHLELNNNAFAYIDRDDNGYPIGIYPITTTMAEAIRNGAGELFIRFTLRSGKTATFRYSDIIHLRKDFNDNEIFGTSPAKALSGLMEVVTTTDQGIVKAIKNSSVIRWLLKFSSTLRPEDLKKQTKEFVETFLSSESETVGAAGTDAKMDAKQIDPKDYVPNAVQMDRTKERIYAFFNTNEKIAQSSYSENEWISYYEGSVEPDVVQMTGEYTRKLFTRRERGYGNKVVFEASNLTFASMQTKLNLVLFVDRGVMNANEVREILNLAPYEGGDEYVRRLDTRPTTE